MKGHSWKSRFLCEVLSVGDSSICGGDGSDADISGFSCKSYGLGLQSIALAFAGKEILLANTFFFLLAQIS